MSDLGQTRDWKQLCEAAEAERDEWIAMAGKLTAHKQAANVRAEAAEAEVTRLREALECSECPPDWVGECPRCAALAAPTKEDDRE